MKQENKTEAAEKVKKTEKNKPKNSNPNLALRIWYGFKKVWRQTFPSELDIEEVFEKRKEEALKFKSELVDFTDEQIDEVRK